MKRIASLAAIAALGITGIALANTASAAVAPPALNARMSSGSITARTRCGRRPMSVGCALDSDGQEMWIQDFGAVVLRPS